MIQIYAPTEKKPWFPRNGYIIGMILGPLMSFRWYWDDIGMIS